MCTEFFLLTNENNLLSGRTFDFPFNPHYKINHTKKNTLINLIQKNESFENNSIKSLYNFMTLYVYNNKKIITDGINEEKLIVNSLWLEDTVYSKDNDNKKMLFFLDIPHLLLSQCATVNEVKEILFNKKIWTKNVTIDQFKEGLIGKLHYSVHDKNHNSIIIEINNGIATFIENKLQVITNQPNYLWHQINLNNYTAYTNKTTESTHQSSFYNTTVNGNELFGIPGDFTSISRFIKTQKLISFIGNKNNNDKETIAIVDRILGNVTLPKNAMLEQKNNQTIESHSYYSIIKNQNKLEWYIKDDLNINYTTYTL